MQMAGLFCLMIAGSSAETPGEKDARRKRELLKEGSELVRLRLQGIWMRLTITKRTADPAMILL